MPLIQELGYWDVFALPRTCKFANGKTLKALVTHLPRWWYTQIRIPTVSGARSRTLTPQRIRLTNAAGFPRPQRLCSRPSYHTGRPQHRHGCRLAHRRRRDKRSPADRGVKRQRIDQLFPGCRIQLRRIALVPFLARLLAPDWWLACYVLEKIPLLCIHYLGVIRKGEDDASRVPAIRDAGYR
jgi:hypothetical protein